MKFRLNQKGQSLIEYLIIVAIMGVATLGVMRILGQTVQGKFAQVIYALQGDDKKREEIKFKEVSKKHIEERDMSSFMNGSRKGQ